MTGVASTLALAPQLGNAGPLASLPTVVTDDFAELFRYHYPRLVRALVLSGADTSKAEETAQEAFAWTLGHWRRVRAGSNPAGYVFRVAFRLLHARGLLPTSNHDEDAGPAVRGWTTRPRRASMWTARLAAMPPRRRACVIMCWLLDASTSEAAEALGITAGTVRKQLELARTQLTTQLTP